MSDNGNCADGAGPGGVTNATPATGNTMMQQLTALYPITRSITGPGVRASLDLLERIVPLTRHSVASGSSVLDWTVPQEWHFHAGYIESSGGERLVDARHCNLHVVNFSIGVDREMTRDELEPHLHSLPDRPDAIPYRTSYYDANWGFCLSQSQRDALGDGPFRVVIDAERRDGVLDWGEVLIPGESSREILVSTHICHPSLANDNLSGMVLAATLAAERLAALSRDGVRSPFTWRFLFVPGTIGAIAWLAAHRGSMPDIAGGLVLTGLGDETDHVWKSTPQGNSWIDRLVLRVLQQQRPDHHRHMPFYPYGYDERQYGSPGFGLPVGRLTRGVHGTFPEYHTSDDDLSFVTEHGLQQSLELLRAIGRAIDSDVRYRNRAPEGEPQLGKRGLYGATGALPDPGAAQMAMLWLLNRSDGEHSLQDIAEESALSPALLQETAQLLVRHDLLAAEGTSADLPA